MAIQPIDYTQGLNQSLGTGIQLGNAINNWRNQAMQRGQMQQQQERQQAFQQAFAPAYASGDHKAMQDVVGQFPEQLEMVQKAAGFKNENQQLAVGNLAKQMRMAMASGNPQGVAAVAQQNAELLASIGSSPEEVMQQFQQDPEGFSQLVDGIGMSALGVKDYYTVESDRNRLAESQRSHRASEGLQARGQDLSFASQAAGRGQADRHFNQQMAMQQMAAQFPDEAKQLDIEMKRQKVEEVREQKRMAPMKDYTKVEAITDGMDAVLNLARELRTDPTLDRGVGFSPRAYIPGTEGADIRAKMESLQQMIGMQSLQEMKSMAANGSSGLGNVSNKEYEGLMNKLGTLNNSQSAAQVRKQLRSIETYVQASKNRMKKGFKEAYPTYNPQKESSSTELTPSSKFSSLWE